MIYKPQNNLGVIGGPRRVLSGYFGFSPEKHLEGGSLSFCECG